ncbi:MAG: hypothetical protein A4E71_02958 [Smithella sp. PtaU1.Bin162]|nr:MAG: hypothetical protein A4E71_02958 [Smithella sp. PtaU1.Bin162]
MDRQVPVLLIIFNRPEKTRRVIEALQKVKPTRLFVAADGPRPGRPEDIDKCRLARKVLLSIDWSCDLQTRFLEENVGCDPSVSSAINWFFENISQGVILEDDCIPTPAFFHFCSDLLERYKDDRRIMQISGFSPYPERSYPFDYHFSRSFRCWGWGTWRRAWSLYADSLKRYEDNQFIYHIVKSYYPYYPKYIERLKLYKEFMKGRRDNWDFKWNIACYAQNALCIVPEKNLVTNIGFDEEGTHTKRGNHLFARIPTDSLVFPLRHPSYVFADERPERFLEKRLYHSLPFKSRCAKWARHILGSLAEFHQNGPNAKVL